MNPADRAALCASSRSSWRSTATLAQPDALAASARATRSSYATKASSCGYASNETRRVGPASPPAATTSHAAAPTLSSAVLASKIRSEWSCAATAALSSLLAHGATPGKWIGGAFAPWSSADGDGSGASANLESRSTGAESSELSLAASSATASTVVSSAGETVTRGHSSMSSIVLQTAFHTWPVRSSRTHTSLPLHLYALPPRT
mmetsp:Transcript_21275/g.82586  ORF Transcript_21275/g.82586 Transcript_21275/m.82586 type:complete len:205 (-) Transcript_21275:330-944(-)